MHRGFGGRGGRPGGAHRPDVKAQTRHNRYAALDANDDFFDAPDEGASPQVIGQNVRRNVQNVLDKRRDRQVQRETAGRNTGPLLNKVTIQRGSQFGRAFILRSIGQYIDDLKPILFRTNDKGDCTFFVRDDNVAAAIRGISRRIHDPKSNTKLVFFVSKEPPQWADVDANEMQLIRTVLQRRFNPDTQELDLSSFGLDPAFTSQGLNLSLSRNNIAMAVVEMVDELFTNVTAISLQGNRLRFLAYIANIVYRTKNVHTLDLRHNQIDKMPELELLRDWPVRTLYLEYNPICSQYTDQASYISAVHKLFPKVTLLDGVPAQKANDFGLPDLDDDESKPLPPMKPGYYGNDQLRGLVETFLVQYFEQYDGPTPKQTRKRLMEAYDENATFTLAMCNLLDGDVRPRHDNATVAGDYLKSSHNVMMLEKWERYREKIVLRGSMDTAVFLSNLPPSRHEMSTFVVDISLVAGNFMCFTVQGLFRDGANIDREDAPRCFFTRTFFVTSRGDNKIAVLNDLLFVSAVTDERAMRYRLMLKRATEYQEPPIQSAAAMSLGGSAVASSSSSMIVPPPGASEEMQRQQLLQQFARESGMKLEWARKCLEDQGWNYQEAGRVFLELRGQNVIPPEAFS